MIKIISKNAFALGAVAAACVAVLAIVNLKTAPRISEQRLANKLATLAEVLPEGSVTPDLLHDCVLVQHGSLLGSDKPQALYRLRQDGELKAYIIETTAPDGYSGNIELLVAVTPSAEILGSRVLNHQETPGLGDKIEARRSNWIFGFTGKKVTEANANQWAVKKDGGEFDQFTGATITPRAVVNAVRSAVLFISSQPELATLPANCDSTRS